MSTTITEQTDQAEPTALDKAWTAYLAANYQPFGPVLMAATKVLVDAAEEAERPLCVWGDPTPYEVTVRSCCNEPVCEEHEEDHDLLCPEFVAQLREESL